MAAHPYLSMVCSYLTLSHIECRETKLKLCMHTVIVDKNKNLAASLTDTSNYKNILQMWSQNAALMMTVRKGKSASLLVTLELRSVWMVRLTTKGNVNEHLLVAHG